MNKKNIVSSRDNLLLTKKILAMLTQEDKIYLQQKGISEEKLNAQLNNFKTGFPFLKLAGAA